MISKLFVSRYVKALAYVMLFAVAFVALPAAADGDGVFGTITSRLVTTFQNVRTVIFIVGGFGLIGLGFAAIFGKIKWTWLAALAAGLAIVALAGAVVDYVTQNEGGSETVIDERFGETANDTLTGN